MNSLLLQQGNFLHIRNQTENCHKTCLLLFLICRLPQLRMLMDKSADLIRTEHSEFLNIQCIKAPLKLRIRLNTLLLLDGLNLQLCPQSGILCICNSLCNRKSQKILQLLLRKLLHRILVKTLPVLVNMHHAVVNPVTDQLDTSLYKKIKILILKLQNGYPAILFTFINDIKKLMLQLGLKFLKLLWILQDALFIGISKKSVNASGCPVGKRLLVLFMKNPIHIRHLEIKF